MALEHNVTVHAMAAGEKFFIDLLPTTWSGVPPGLPQDVVDDLARRAREAELLLQREHGGAQDQNAAPTMFTSPASRPSPAMCSTCRAGPQCRRSHQGPAGAEIRCPRDLRSRRRLSGAAGVGPGTLERTGQGLLAGPLHLRRQSRRAHLPRQVGLCRRRGQAHGRSRCGRTPRDGVPQTCGRRQGAAPSLADAAAKISAAAAAAARRSAVARRRGRNYAARCGAGGNAAPARAPPPAPRAAGAGAGRRCRPSQCAACRAAACAACRLQLARTAAQCTARRRRHRPRRSDTSAAPAAGPAAAAHWRRSRQRRRNSPSRAAGSCKARHAETGPLPRRSPQPAAAPQAAPAAAESRCSAAAPPPRPRRADADSAGKIAAELSQQGADLKLTVCLQDAGRRGGVSARRHAVARLRRQGRRSI